MTAMIGVPGAADAPAARGPVLELRGVGKRYPGPPALEVLRDVDLAVAAGEMLAIMGPSGSGKSTLLHIMGTLDLPSSGTVHVGGVDVDLDVSQQSYVKAGDRVDIVLPDGRHTGGRISDVGRVAQTSGSGPATGPRNCPAVSSSGSRSPGRWSPDHRSCWPTSRPATSTRLPARTCWSC